MSPAECLSSPKSTGEFAILLGYLVLGCILISWYMFCCQFWRENTFFIFGEQNISLKNWVIGKVTGTNDILFHSFPMSPAYSAKWSSFCVYKIKPLVCIDHMTHSISTLILFLALTLAKLDVSVLMSFIKLIKLLQTLMKHL